MKPRFSSGLLIMLTCVFSATVSANMPRDVEDIVGKKSHRGDNKLQERGYVHIETQRGSSHNSWGMWWNPSSRQCVTVRYEDGRIRNINNSPPVDCNQNVHHSKSDDGAGAALAVGAVALIGALALSHKSHHHENNQHNQDPAHESEFERGHRDGLYNKSFDNYNHVDAYAIGYQSGVEQRDNDAAYRHHSGRYDNGYQKTVEFKDLNGSRASSANKALKERGFREVDDIKDGRTAYSYWYNGYTSQCLQMTVSDGRALDIRDIYQHPLCR